MARELKVKVNGEEVAAVELSFETKREEWNEYTCEDGSTVRLKTVVQRVYRTEKRNQETGEPIYLVRSSNVMDVVPPEDVGGVH